MSSKVLSLLGMLFGALAVVLFSMERRRVRRAGELLPLVERIEYSVSTGFDTGQADARKLKERLRALRARTGTAPGPATQDAPDPALTAAAAQTWGRHKRAVAEALQLNRDLSTNPDAAALSWRLGREQRFDRAVTDKRLKGKLGLTGTRLARVRQELLAEYFQLYRSTDRAANKRRRGETDGRIKSGVYKNDAAGYQKYTTMRRQMAARRAGAKPAKR